MLPDSEQKQDCLKERLKTAVHHIPPKEYFEMSEVEKWQHSIDIWEREKWKMLRKYLTPEQLTAVKNVNYIIKKMRYGLKEELDEEKFLVEYCKAVIKGWKGLKFRYLEELLLVDISELKPDDCLPYTPENAELLMKNSADMDSWVTETVGDLENFTSSK